MAGVETLRHAARPSEQRSGYPLCCGVQLCVLTLHMHARLHMLCKRLDSEIHIAHLPFPFLAFPIVFDPVLEELVLQLSRL